MNLKFFLACIFLSPPACCEGLLYRVLNLDPTGKSNRMVFCADCEVEHRYMTGVIQVNTESCMLKRMTDFKGG